MHPNYGLIFGLALITIGPILIYLSPMIVNYIIKTQFVISPSSKLFDGWQKTPFPLKCDYYVFNWTNPNDVYNKSITPHFQQLGPYRYYQTRDKVNLVWNHENNTVTYQIVNRWYFDKENTNGTLEDVINTINPASRSLGYIARSQNYIVKKGLSMVLNRWAPKVHVTKTVGEMLFDGYEDPFVTIGTSMPFMKNKEYPDVDRIGFLYGKNGTDFFDGVYNVATGEGPDNIGSVLSWGYKNHSKGYTEGCRKVDGSAGEFFPRNLQKDRIKLYSPDICRAMVFDYEEESVVHGIKVYKYGVDKSLLDNGTNVPENKCYCEGNCQPSGALNITICAFDTPSFLSLPHFYKADPFYRQIVSGMEPQKDKHQFYMSIEPKTGIPLEVAARIQFNMLVEPDDYITVFQNLPVVYFPLFWIDQSVTVKPEMASQLQILLNLDSIIFTISCVIFSVGLFVLGLIVAPRVYNRFSNEKSATITKNEEVPLNDKDELSGVGLILTKNHRR